jgi:GT2 family glycosyltransferase
MSALSVVICTRNRAASLADAVADVQRQLGPEDELLVVDQSDDPVDLPGVRVLRDGLRGLPRARNLGLAATTRPIVWFVDDDVRLRPGCLEAHRAAYADRWVGGVTGAIDEVGASPNAATTRNDVGWDGRVHTRLTGDRAVSLGTLKGANMSFRRVALLAAGPCDEGFGGSAFLEDADWSARVAALGWKLRFEPAAALVHLVAPAGGCRVDDREAWRFYNTARFVRRHQAWTAPFVALTFGAIAARGALSGSPAASWVASFVRGWRSDAADRPTGG